MFSYSTVFEKLENPRAGIELEKSFLPVSGLYLGKWASQLQKALFPFPFSLKIPLLCHAHLVEKSRESKGFFFFAVLSLSRVQLFGTPQTAACQASLCYTVSHSLVKLMSIESVMPSNHVIRCRPLLLLLSVFPSIRDFCNESALLIRWPKYWRFSFSISPSNEYPRVISIRIYWFDLQAVQGTLKSLLQHHNSKAPILQLS